MEDNLGLRGDVKIILRDENGNVIDKREIENTIVDVGYDAICAAIGSTSQPNDFAWTAIGTSVVAVQTSDTALGSEASRVANLYAHTPTTKVFTMTAEYAATVGTGAITESGLLNDATVGTLLNRVVFDVINKGAADTLTVVWTITLS